MRLQIDHLTRSRERIMTYPTNLAPFLCIALCILSGCKPSAESYAKSAYSKLRSGDQAGAISEYSEAIRAKPGLESAYVGRGIAREKIGDNDGAIVDLTEALRLNPNDAVAYDNRAVAWESKGDHAKAILDATAAIRLKPNAPEAFYNRGSSKGASGDYAGSVADLTEAIRLKPTDAEYYFNRGLSRERMQDQSAAISDYSQAIQLRPEYAKALHRRAVLREKTGDHGGAISDSYEVRRINHMLSRPDAQLSREITGTWRHDRPGNPFLLTVGKDGSFSSALRSPKVTNTWSGTWAVSNGFFVTTATKSNDVSIYSISRCGILRLDSHTLICEIDYLDNETITYSR